MRHNTIRPQTIPWRAMAVLGASILLFLVCSHGCGPTGGTGLAPWDDATPAGIENKGATISVFLNLKEPSGPAAWLLISSIEVLADQVWMPLNERPIELDAKRIGSGQAHVATTPVPAGSFSQLRITVEKAALRKGGEMLFLSIEKPSLVFPISGELDLVRGDSQCLLLTWDVGRSFLGSAIIDPAITAAAQSIPLTSDLAYAACPGINTVYVIRTDRNWVTGALGIPGRPSYLALDQPRNRLYVLADREAAIKVLELSTSRIVDKIQIPLMPDPNFMTLDPDNLSAYVLDQRGSYVARIDLRTGTLAGRVRVGNGLEYAAYLPDQRLLAVSSALSGTVFLLDPETLAIAESVPVGNSPQGTAVWKNHLYIAESASNTVSDYDLETKEIRARINVGMDPRRIHLNRDRIYVTNFRGGAVSVLLPGQLGVLRDIKTGGNPLEMASSSGRRWLYVGNPSSRSVTVVDLTAGKVAGEIALGASPQGLAALQ